MVAPDYNVEEKQLDGATHKPDKNDHSVFSHKEIQQETSHEAAERGRAATDK
jgi:hypothetical protein